MALDYNNIRKNIENLIKNELDTLNKELETKFDTIESDGYVAGINYEKKVNIGDPLCVSFFGEYKRPNWNILKEKIAPIYYKLNIGYILKGVYLHKEDANSHDPNISTNCSLIPIYKSEKDYHGSVANHDAIKYISDRFNKIQDKLSKYVKSTYPSLKDKIFFKDAFEPNIKYYRLNHSDNPEQYREYFMDLILSEMVSNPDADITSYLKYTTEFGVNIKIDEESIMNHMEFKKNHGYEVVREYAAFLSKGNIKKLALKGIIEKRDNKSIDKESKKVKNTNKDSKDIDHKTAFDLKKHTKKSEKLEKERKEKERQIAIRKAEANLYSKKYNYEYKKPSLFQKIKIFFTNFFKRNSTSKSGNTSLSKSQIVGSFSSEFSLSAFLYVLIPTICIIVVAILSMCNVQLTIHDSVLAWFKQMFGIDVNFFFANLVRVHIFGNLSFPSYYIILGIFVYIPCGLLFLLAGLLDIILIVLYFVFFGILYFVYNALWIFFVFLGGPIILVYLVIRTIHCFKDEENPIGALACILLTIASLILHYVTFLPAYFA